MPAKVKLQFIEGERMGQVLTFAEPTSCLFGRATDCTVAFAAANVSRHHCRLSIDPPFVRIVDLGSRNGTYVNGELIGRRDGSPESDDGIKLQSGDEIRLDKHTVAFKVLIEDEPEEEWISEGDWEAINLFLNKNLPAPKAYTVIEDLGQDGQSRDYLVRRDDTGGKLVVKILPIRAEGSEQKSKRFLEEIQISKAIRHPNIVQLRHCGYDEPKLYLATEHCNGGDLLGAVEHAGGQLPLKPSVAITLHIADALEYAHEVKFAYRRADGSPVSAQGLVHRYISPANLLLSGEKGNRRVKVAKYGFARALSYSGLNARGANEEADPGFTSRRLASNFNDVSPAVDLWSLAATLYYFLTGTPPREFPKDYDIEERWRVVLTTPPVPVRDRNPSVPIDLAAFLDDALADDRPFPRYTNATDFKQALRNAASRSMGSFSTTY